MRGEGVKGRLEFGKFIRFGSLTRPLQRNPHLRTYIRNFVVQLFPVAVQDFSLGKALLYKVEEGG